MKKFTWALLGLFLVVPAQSQELNPPVYPTRSDTIALADKLEVQGTMHVMVFTDLQREPRVSFQGPEPLLSDAMATVKDGTLTLAFKDGKPYSSNPGSRLSAVVYLPSIDGVKVEKSPAEVRVFGNNSDEFSAAVGGAGQIKIERLEAKRMNAAIGGAGSIRIEGTADEASFAIGGAGSIEGKRLRVATAKIAVGGAGSVYADVSDTADIVVGGSGRVEIVGGATCNIRPDSIDKVECR
ncbi:MAG: DUF2807 domain-containing protein [Pseudomonadota bacterium]